MTDEERDRLIDGFKTHYAEYGDWKFDYEYPGFFTFYNDQFQVYFTPDWTDEGFADIQINKIEDQGNPFRIYSEPFSENRSAERLFEIVKPYLDDPLAVRRRKGGTLDWIPP